MRIRIYKVEGEFYDGWEWRKFGIEVLATKVRDAVEKVLSEIGSRHKVKRALIRIHNVREITPEEVSRRREHILRLLELTSIPMEFIRRRK